MTEPARYHIRQASSGSAVRERAQLDLIAAYRLSGAGEAFAWVSPEPKEETRQTFDFRRDSYDFAISETGLHDFLANDGTAMFVSDMRIEDRSGELLDYMTLARLAPPDAQGDGLIERTEELDARKLVLDARERIISAREEALLRRELLLFTADLSSWEDAHDKPSPQAVDDAMEFVRRRPEGVPMPRPDMPVDGEIAVYWRDGGLIVEVVFGGEGTCYYYGEVVEKGEVKRTCKGDGIAVTKKWPSDIEALLNGSQTP